MQMNRFVALAACATITLAGCATDTQPTQSQLPTTSVTIGNLTYDVITVTKAEIDALRTGEQLQLELLSDRTVVVFDASLGPIGADLVQLILPSGAAMTLSAWMQARLDDRTVEAWVFGGTLFSLSADAGPAAGAVLSASLGTAPPECACRELCTPRADELALCHVVCPCEPRPDYNYDGPHSHMLGDHNTCQHENCPEWEPFQQTTDPNPPCPGCGKSSGNSGNSGSSGGSGSGSGGSGGSGGGSDSTPPPSQGGTPEPF